MKNLILIECPPNGHGYANENWRNDPNRREGVRRLLHEQQVAFERIKWALDAARTAMDQCPQVVRMPGYHIPGGLPSMIHDADVALANVERSVQRTTELLNREHGETYIGNMAAFGEYM